MIAVKLLVVEDDPNYLGLLQRYLTHLVDKLIFAKTWKEANAFVEWADIVWLDVVLPDANEEQSLINIGAARQRNSGAVIFVVSGVMSPQFPEQAVKAGADMFVHKHEAVTETQVVALVLQAINRIPGIDAGKVHESARQLFSDRIKSTP